MQAHTHLSVPLGALLALSACATPLPYEDALMQESFPIVLDGVAAVLFEEECPGLSANEDVMDAALAPMLDSAQGSGWTEEQFYRALERTYANEKMGDTVVARLAEAGVPRDATVDQWCRAGRAEMARGTRLGSFLK